LNTSKLLSFCYRHSVLSSKNHGRNDGRDAAHPDRFLLIPELPENPDNLLVNVRIRAHPEGGQVLGGAESSREDDGRKVVCVQFLELV
jgi:hypothetical protein